MYPNTMLLNIIKSLPSTQQIMSKTFLGRVQGPPTNPKSCGNLFPVAPHEIKFWQLYSTSGTLTEQCNKGK